MTARRPAALLVVLAVVVLSFGAGAGASRALLSDQEAAASTFTSGTWGTTASVSVSAHDLRDYSTGSAQNFSSPYAYADGVAYRTSNWTSAFSATRYMQWDYGVRAPAGLTVTAATFDLSIRPDAAAETTCWYVEVRRASDNSLLGTHGSSGSPYACTTGGSFVTYNVALSEVASTDIANDLRVKLFANESNGKTDYFDLATVTVTTASGSFTYYPRTTVDASSGSPTTSTWSLSVVDGAFYTEATNWPTSFNTGRYLLFTFHPWVPAGATISAASLTNVYQSATSGPTTCYYFEVWSGGGSLLATHGSSGSPESCHTGNTSWTTWVTTLSEVSTAAEANGLQVKMFFRSSGSNRSRQDQLKLDLTYTY